ncbi:PREDICTED: zinc finger CCCH domain-containing protein 45-like isoform X1 [Camelina sativa]|uniref:Zinc finger CCCH domain-containing protein 45-like isoform X1 n=1 Tax=Camelina sativa TaxID=90675 RepID=A0ABM0THX2_CAMSA|nr:PREDICTED: zinc finger CCCH domain-containing protein 45-like isoform X1 [Camelina sativa]
MKRSKKPRVSWPPGPKLCQVKMFRTEECPAKVASQPLRHLKLSSSRVPDLPPGFEGNHYAVKPNVSNIPRIKWKRPPQFSISDAWLVGGGGESTERQTENLRISKVLQAIYPHRSAIPSRPSVSPVVEAECFDDSKTPAIRLTPIEDESDSSEDSSHSTVESGFTANKQGQLETKPPCSTQELASGLTTTGLAPDLSLAASAALSVLMKTKEQGSMVDTDLLIKFLSNPKMIKNLITDSSGKSSETKNPPVDTNINSTTRLVPQPVPASPMVRKPQPVIIPQEHSVAASPYFTNPQRRVSPPKPGTGNISPPKPINVEPSSIPMPAHFHVGIAKEQPLPARFPSSSLPMNLNLHRPPNVFSEPKVIVNPQPQHQPGYAFRTSEMNNVQSSIGLGRGPQTGFNSYPMNINRGDTNGRPNPVVQPMKGLDYFKNLIREHGTDNHETNQYISQTGIFNGRIDNNKIQKQCIYFGTASGCKLGDSCLYVHDRFRPNFEAEAPTAKRMKFGRYEKNGF